MNPRASTSPATFSPMSRRAFLLGIGTTAFALAACGGEDNAASGAGSRTVDGALGTIDVPESPQRVVSVGQYRDTDAAVALGVVPLLNPDLSLFMEGGVSPWVTEVLGDEELDIVDVSEMPYEQISAVEPDLILATDRQNLDEEYDRLSQIAPTLSWDDGYNEDDWITTTTRIGEALGKSTEAEEVIRTTEEAISTARSDNTDFAGLTFTLGPVTAEGVINTINSTDDASVEFLNDLGLELSPSVTDLPNSGIPGRAIISPEEVSLLDADILMLTFNTPEARTRLEADPLFQQIPAVRRGAYVALELPVAIAIGFPSALSVRYGVDKLVPLIRAAIDASGAGAASAPDTSA